MIKPARASITVWTGLSLPFVERTGTKAHRHNEFRLPTLSKQRLAISVTSYPRFPSRVKVQVRSSRHIPLSTPWLHQGCDSPPQHRSPVRGRTAVPCPYEYEQHHEKKRMNRSRCVVRSSLDPVPSCRESRENLLLLQGTPEQPYPTPCSFPQSCPSHPTPNFPAWSR